MKTNSLFRLLQTSLVALFVATACHAQDPVKSETEWMAVMLNGQKAGHMKLVRTEQRDQVIHEESMSMALMRSGTALKIETTDETVETTKGEPVSFVSRQNIGGGEMVITGQRMDDGRFEVETVSAGNSQTQSLEWPDGALLPEALRLLSLETGLTEGASLRTSVFIPSSLQATDVEINVVGRENIDLFGVDSQLWRVEQTTFLGNTESRLTAYVDDHYNTKKMIITIMGLTLETIACPRECALSASEPAEFFAQTFADAPRSLSRNQLSQPLTYQISTDDEAGKLFFPESAEQSVTKTEDGYEITIRSITEPIQQSRFDDPDADFLSQTRWLQSDAPIITRLAADARGSATQPLEVMTRLQDFVRDYVHDKNLSVGYATALETAQNRSGDCTEHALLLAAMGRASGIPTRIATGLAYVDSWLGARDVFVPHAWTQALIDGRWVSFDAALGRFDGGHLALAYGDGDPWHFYDSINTIGNFSIEAIQVGTK